MIRHLAVLALITTAAAARLTAATVTVNDSGDSTNACATTGVQPCTLRDAITYANANSGTVIDFDIPGPGVQTIQPATDYPAITKPVTIDGYSQPGASANTNGPTQGTNAVILIELDGTNTHSNGALNLGTGSDGTVIRGLAINRNFSACIQIAGGSNHVIEGNFIGTDPTGMVAHGCGDGISAETSGTNVTIGGTTPAARNLVSGNESTGIYLNGGSGHHIQGNLVGTDATGAAALPGAIEEGIILGPNTSNTTVGGTTPAERNVVSGNGGNGIRTETNVSPGIVVSGNYVGTDVTGTIAVPNKSSGVTGEGHGVTIGGSAPGAGNLISGNLDGAMFVAANGVIIQGNVMGLDASGTLPIPNSTTTTGSGIFVDGSNTTIGGVNPGEGNVIAYSGGNFGAIRVFESTSISGTTVRGNSIHDNPGIAFSIDGSGTPLANDPCDVDTGNNNLQNFPVLKSVSYGANTTVSGVLNSTASTTFDIDFYADPPCARFPGTFLQGATYLGTTQVTTNGSCIATIDVSDLPSVPAGSQITMTATDPSGNTSEFSQRLPFSVTPRSGPGAGGTAVTISGTSFLASPTVTIGGVSANNIDVVSDTSITATTPALAPGSANDVVVANTDGTTGTYLKGFVADFLDVPNTNGVYEYVTLLVSNGITAGTGGGLYGVNDDTQRQQMAVFILKAKHGVCYKPPVCTGHFVDVPCPGGFADWIEELAAENITSGCDATHFCPSDPVRRDQMAAFLLKAEHGSGYKPPTCTGIFTDVTCPSGFANWIEELYNEHITGGCNPGMYCPAQSNTRGQMAVFIDKTFSLQ